MHRSFFHGMGDVAPQQPPVSQVVERGFDYAYQITLSASQSLTDQVLSVNGDADFIVKAICGTSTGTYTIRLKDAHGYYLSSAQLKSANVVGTRVAPAPMFPELFIPRAGKLGIDITDTSGASNVVEIVFIGVKRY
jgi:hypothetical protein